jgi:hypothetical protein
MSADLKRSVELIFFLMIRAGVSIWPARLGLNTA